LLIEAFALAKQQCPARLIILGEGELRQSLEQTIGELGLKGSVELPGFVANPRSFMSRAAVIAMSSDWEALPMTLIEALSLGKPIVATDCPSGPGEILAGGKYGRLVPAGNAGALAEAICDGLKGKIPSPPTESWQRYRVESITGEYVALFEEAAA
jgi:glycosyltransferase involved in cell wall biosynthesis